MRVLYVSTEVYPALKTGGLADVNAALPRALIDLGCDVRLLLPAFPALVAAASSLRPVVELGPAASMIGGPAVTAFAPAALTGPAAATHMHTDASPVRIAAGMLNGVPAYLIDAPAFYARPGNPYLGPDGRDWPDNLERFALLGAVAARFADGGIDGFRPDIIHGHDWHAGLAPAYLAARGGYRPASVTTVHNLAFHGEFPAEAFPRLHLPAHFFSPEGLEFYGSVNFMKAALHYADRITTVSPTYAREIQTPEQGCGMDGLLRARAAALVGILNGVDPDDWSPAHDRRIAANYDRERLDGKAACKAALRATMNLSPASTGPLFGVVSRLTTQKGVDLLLDALPALLQHGGQLALLGGGDRALEQGFIDAAAMHPGAIAARIGYDEDLAHAIVAGADVMLVPSRFEPCGLTQMYGLAYGTLPLVRRVGGLADTVRDADDGGHETGNGFVFDAASVYALAGTIIRAIDCWHQVDRWRSLQLRGMADDHGWGPSARAYVDVYRQLRPAAFVNAA